MANPINPTGSDAPTAFIKNTMGEYINSSTIARITPLSADETTVVMLDGSASVIEGSVDKVAQGMGIVTPILEIIEYPEAPYINPLLAARIAEGQEKLKDIKKPENEMQVSALFVLPDPPNNWTKETPPTQEPTGLPNTESIMPVAYTIRF